MTLMVSVINRFSAATGLKASPTKCKVYFGGVAEDMQQKILAINGFVVGSLPFKYLGVPLVSRKLTAKLCRPLIDKIVSKITHWTTKLLSYADKQHLVMSVIFNVTNYWMQVFPMPKCVIKHIEVVCKHFVGNWGAKITRMEPIAWDKMCEPKNAEGLNITYIKEWNMATLGKLL